MPTLRATRPRPRLVVLIALATLASACANHSRNVTSAPPVATSADSGRVLTPKVAPLSPEERAFSAQDRARIDATSPVVAAAAREHSLDPALINAVIWVESRFRADARSKAGARGLMQLMPATAAALAKQMGETRPRIQDPRFNVRAGSFYLARLTARFADETLAIAAYHAGPGNVRKWLSSGAAFPEYVQRYVDSVYTARQRFDDRVAADAGTPRHAATRVPAPVHDPAPATAVPIPDEPRATASTRSEPARPATESTEEPVFRAATELDPPTPAPDPAWPRARAQEPSAGERPAVGIGILPDV